jgi:hypothetical protein
MRLPDFFLLSCSAFSFLCSNNTELATAFVTNGGVEFLLEYLENFCSNQHLVHACFVLHKFVIESLDGIEQSSFAGRTLEHVVDVFVLYYETQDEQFYQHYCFAVANSFLAPDLDLVVERKCHHRAVHYVWCGIFIHEKDGEGQDFGRFLLRQLVGEEIAKQMIDQADAKRMISNAKMHQSPNWDQLDL